METDENGFIPVQTMLDAEKAYGRRQGLDNPIEAFTQRRLRELLGATVQKRVREHKKPTRSHIGYSSVADRDDEYPFYSVNGVTGNY